MTEQNRFPEKSSYRNFIDFAVSILCVETTLRNVRCNDCNVTIITLVILSITKANTRNKRLGSLAHADKRRQTTNIQPNR